MKPSTDRASWPSRSAHECSVNPLRLIPSAMMAFAVLFSGVSYAYDPDHFLCGRSAYKRTNIVEKNPECISIHLIGERFFHCNRDGLMLIPLELPTDADSQIFRKWILVNKENPGYFCKGPMETAIVDGVQILRLKRIDGCLNPEGTPYNIGLFKKIYGDEVELVDQPTKAYKDPLFKRLNDCQDDIYQIIQDRFYTASAGLFSERRGNRYRLKDPASPAGSNKQGIRAYTNQHPLDRPFSRFTSEEKATFRAEYEGMVENDEPPFPQNGFGKIVNEVARLSSAMGVVGEVHINAFITKEGRAVQFTLVKSPDPNVANYIMNLLSEENYKPGVCEGKPCDMELPFRLKLAMK